MKTRTALILTSLLLLACGAFAQSSPGDDSPIGHDRTARETSVRALKCR
jgi:hypothetical protein